MIEIKVADEMDNAALAKIYYDIRLKEFVWEKEVCMDDFKKSTEGERILAGLVDGAIAGFISVWEPDLFVHNLFVCKQYRRTGLGAALIAEANRKYGSPLSLKCMKDNKNALTFYEKNGWKIRESGMCEAGEYYFMVQDAVENRKKQQL